MKAKELRGKKPDELKGLERDLRRELAEMNIKKGLGTFAKTARLLEVRRDIARILTLQREKESV